MKEMREKGKGPSDDFLLLPEPLHDGPQVCVAMVQGSGYGHIRIIQKVCKRVIAPQVFLRPVIADADLEAVLPEIIQVLSDADAVGAEGKLGLGHRTNHLPDFLHIEQRLPAHKLDGPGRIAF